MTTYVALVESYPLDAHARRSLHAGDAMPDDVPYLGVWRMPEPYGGVVHVFSDEMTAEQLTAAQWTQEDA